MINTQKIILRHLISSLRCHRYHGNVVLNKRSKFIDLRSDTVTKPSKEMLYAMFEANVGDDVYKEDQTVNELEKTCAELFGMEKALFVPSGTMGNLLCIMSHCTGRGEELIIGSNQHVYCYEQGHFMQFASVAARVIPNERDGTMCLESIRKNIRDDSDFHGCVTKLICLENTHMEAGGVPLPLDYLHQVSETATFHNIKIHIDGARLYNAAVALEKPVKDLLVNANSVSMCLSKGLGCPVGSVIGGNEDFINRAIRIRKGLGGGLRQSGFLAAAGLHALENADKTLLRDHVKAENLARGINDLKCEDLVSVGTKKPRTNILFLKTKEDFAQELVRKLSKHGVLAGAFNSSTIRLVTHQDVNDDDISCVIERLDHVIKDIIT